MDLAKASSTNFILWDDVEGSGKNEHQLWVRGMNGAARNTVGRGKSCKLAGTLVNKNLLPNETMHPKVRKLNPVIIHYVELFLMQISYPR